MEKIIAEQGAYVILSYEDPNHLWTARLTYSSPQTQIHEYRLELEASEPQVPPRFSLDWSFPQNGICARWGSGLGMNRNLPPSWACQTRSQLASNSPEMTLYDNQGINHMTFAFSDALRDLDLGAGIKEEDSHVICYLHGFITPEAPRKSYSAVLRIDERALFYADSVRDAFHWLEEFYPPTKAPEQAFQPIYSSWYSYHKAALNASCIEKQAGLAKELGLDTVIVDDGWQTDRYDGGAYAYCGDWQPVASRFPDMKTHVQKVHEAGLNYVLWYSVPFVGTNSEAFQRFHGKFLYCRENLGAWVLDPRFPEVREYLIGLYETAMKEWKLDGFKLDFIDSFPCFGPVDPASLDNYAGRDCKTVPEGVNQLLIDVMDRLRRINPDVLIEFRQSYVGPAVKQYGNLLRAGDCPSDALANRIRTMDLRLSSGSLAVHSDMLSWDYSDSVESAIAQLHAVLFSVPQISVRLEEIPPAHLKALQFWISFWKCHVNTLLHGKLVPLHPELNYPLVYAEADSEEECIVVSYDSGRCVDVDSARFGCVYLVNASGSRKVVVKGNQAGTIDVFSCFGERVASCEKGPGFFELEIPVSGYAVFRA